MKNFSVLHPALRAAAAALVSQFKLQVTSVGRSLTLQRKLYQRYLNGQHKYTVLPPGRSDHELKFTDGRSRKLYSWAFDAWHPDRNVLRAAGKVWRSWGGRWGDEADPVHFGGPRLS